MRSCGLGIASGVSHSILRSRRQVACLLVAVARNIRERKVALFTRKMEIRRGRSLAPLASLRSFALGGPWVVNSGSGVQSADSAPAKKTLAFAIRCGVDRLLPAAFGGFICDGENWHYVPFSALGLVATFFPPPLARHLSAWGTQTLVSLR